jgi:hypothetical protein
VNDLAWFKSLINSSDDGIAVDIVDKERYNCDLPTIIGTQIKGALLKPIYGQKLLNGLKVFDKNVYRVHVGKINDNLIGKELEYNILFIHNKNMCRYQVTYNLASYPWDLLDMGLYLDSLTYSQQTIKTNTTQDIVLKNKTIVFKIPFEQNKSNYSQADIKPLYDSLRLTDYTIKAIQIKAYASVEGSTERNLALQEQRAKSIADALQAYQKPTMTTEVSTSENWVEFLNDIKTSKYVDLGSMSKEQIKTKLVGNLAKELEPFLQKHRKAVVRLELEKIDAFENLSADVLVDKFNAAITNGKLNEASEIQNSIFKKMQSKATAPSQLLKMQIPKQVKYVNFLNKNASFRYIMNPKEMLIVYNELLELEKLAPKEGAVKYNIAALKIKLWRYKAIEINEQDLKNQINDLQQYKIQRPLIDRMMVNFHIIKAENLMQKRDFKNKDLSVAFIENNYKNLNMSNNDYLSLAQFFTYYANIDKAVKLLETKTKQIDIDEDLLFYYLNLTIVDKELTHKKDYRTILMNANNINNKRFCKLFNPIEVDGVTFQLLENEYLRNAYCESCQ